MSKIFSTQFCSKWNWCLSFNNNSTTKKRFFKTRNIENLIYKYPWFQWRIFFVSGNSFIQRYLFHTINFKATTIVTLFKDVDKPFSSSKGATGITKEPGYCYRWSYQKHDKHNQWSHAFVA